MLDSLLDKKGMLSRKIGEAKRNGFPIDELLLEMKSVSSAIKLEQKRLKDAENSSKAVNSQFKSKDDAFVPALFQAEVKTKTFCGVAVSKVGDEFKDDWDKYVLSRPDSSIYHRFEFKKVIESSFGHKSLYLVARDSSGQVVGVLPAIEMKSALFGHFITSLPYFTYGGVLAEGPLVEDELIAYLVSYAETKNVGHIEFRHQRVAKSKVGDFSCRENKVSMVRSLPDSADQLWGDVGTKVRAQIKKSDRFGFECVFGGAELVDDFYAVFARNMRDLGTPVYSKRFFRQLTESELSKSFVIGVVYQGGKPVSCCFLMIHNGMMEVPWASALREYNSKNVNMFMYWNILQKAVECECQFFDFGRSSKDASTYRFKKQWGAKPIQLYWYYWLPKGSTLPELNPNNPKYKLLISVWQRLPVWLSKLIGPPIVKYLP